MRSTSLQLTQYSDEDHARTYKWLQDSKLRYFIGTRSSPTEVSHKKWLKMMRERNDIALFSIYEGLKHIGNVRLVDISQSDYRAEVQIFLGTQDIQSKGIGRQAIELIKLHASEKLGLHRLYAYVFEFNTSAANMFLATNFKKEGILREHRKQNEDYCNVLLFGCILND